MLRFFIICAAPQNHPARSWTALRRMPANGLGKRARPASERFRQKGKKLAAEKNAGRAGRACIGPPGVIQSDHTHGARAQMPVGIFRAVHRGKCFEKIFLNGAINGRGRALFK